MKWMEQQSRYENVLYAVLWGILFAAPVMSIYVRTAGDSTMTFDWNEVFVVWRQYGVFLLLFLIHNFLLAPLLVYRQRQWLYAATTVAMLTVFVVYQCNSRPYHLRPRDRMPHRMEQRAMPPDGGEAPNHEPPTFERRGDGPRHDDAPWRDDGPRRDFQKRRHIPPAIVGQHDIIATVILVLMLGMNLGVKLYFKSRRDQKKLADLEKQNLSQQLEYLKYQINPHFFMNTLNNIHALVDIDPQKAQETILELSKMMRFILYEGSKQGVPLSREFDFIRNYITLMRLRYTDHVRITVELPAEVPDATVPPLMLISFIENAFKHGISYQHDSFIDISITVDHQRLHFHCRNSKAEKSNEEKGGVGLANVKQRLNLLYDDNYTLDIEDSADVYDVTLVIPLSRDGGVS
jgi:hypothetical protein